MVALVEEVDELLELVTVRRIVWLDGIAAVRSAITTTWPAASPSVISIHPPPTAPVLTEVVAGVSELDASTCTVAVPVPVGVTAETGTMTTPVTDFTGTVTDALDPLASRSLGSGTPTVVV